MTNAEAVTKFDSLPNNRKAELICNFHLEKSKVFENETAMVGLYGIIKEVNSRGNLTAEKVKTEFILFGDAFIPWLTVNLEMQLAQIELKAHREIISE